VVRPSRRASPRQPQRRPSLRRPGLRERIFDEHHHGGRGGGRFFDPGELRLVVLKLNQIKPRHGYKITKDIEERLAAAYTPSPGTIYPTLTLLEELGQVAVTPEEGGKTLHTIRPDGDCMLAAARHVDAIFARLDGPAVSVRRVPPCRCCAPCTT
jgi:DNA-binding PadR family transcriptional regulator